MRVARMTGNLTSYTYKFAAALGVILMEATLLHVVPAEFHGSVRFGAGMIVGAIVWGGSRDVR